MLLLSGFIGALLGAGVTLLFNIWKFHRDERTARLDELCGAISATALLASEYWASEFKDEPEQRVREARILGGQALVDGLYADLRPMLRASDCGSVDEVLSALFDAMSGGKFSVKGRPQDAARVAAAPQSASSAMVEMRRCHRRTMPLSTLVHAYHENKHRELDMPDRQSDRY